MNIDCLYFSLAPVDTPTPVVSFCLFFFLQYYNESKMFHSQWSAQNTCRISRDHFNKYFPLKYLSALTTAPWAMSLFSILLIPHNFFFPSLSFSLPASEDIKASVKSITAW